MGIILFLGLSNGWAGHTWSTVHRLVDTSSQSGLLPFASKASLSNFFSFAQLCFAAPGMEQILSAWRMHPLLTSLATGQVPLAISVAKAQRG